MRSRRSYPLLGLLVVLAAALATVSQPEPPKADANIVCDAVGGAGGTITGGIEAIGGAVGGANPIGDACDAVTGKAVGAITSPVTDAIEGIGHGIFDQITTWVSEGAGWLIEQVASEIEKTTSPNLTSEGFLAEYGQMAEISAVLAAAMVLLAMLEAIAQGSWGLLARAVLVNLPLAFIATSMAFVVVQMLLVATDGMCHGIAAATHEHSQRFFKSAITGLSKTGAAAGAAGGKGTPSGEATGAVGGAVAAPLFVVFLTSIVGAFAAFFVWLELLAREASIYVVALFLPPTFATAIWPRWSGALRRACELLVVIISSKFVIVTIIALAASLVAAKDGSGIQPLLLASALMLLACFAPFMLLKLVPFAEGATSAAYGRRSASGGAVSGLQLAYEAQMIRNMARSNMGASPPEVWNVAGGGSGDDNGSGGGSSPRPVGGGGSGSAGAPGSSGANAGGAAAGASQRAASAGAASPASAAASVPLATARGARSSAGHLAQSGVAQAASEGSPGQGAGVSGQQERSPEVPASDGASGSKGAASEVPPRPPQELSVKGDGKGPK
ncbi:MAG: hypothetical protein QOF85_169 [Solirubrobacterales bacterium]|jgi:hypothetical protein|nr:hypothetical protein [Solirubrobacterales bacterium]